MFSFLIMHNSQKLTLTRMLQILESALIPKVNRVNRMKSYTFSHLTFLSWVEINNQVWGTVRVMHQEHFTLRINPHKLHLALTR